jgi:hypothetical protein
MLRYVYFWMRGYTGGCADHYDALMFYVCVVNQGNAPAGAFTITVNDEDRARVEGLAAGVVECIESGYYNFGYNPVVVVLDRYNEVSESDESNNVWNSVYPLPIPTPPALCTATPTDTPTAVASTPTVTATASPTGALSPTRTPTVTATPTLSTIEGYVWDDADRDGIKDEDERGISGLRVMLDPVAFGWLQPRNDRTTVTDADGYYRFGDVAPGLHTVQVEDPVGRWPTTPVQVITNPKPHQTVPISFGFYAPPVIRHVPLVLH